jgi:hypothetical protein
MGESELSILRQKTIRGLQLEIRIIGTNSRLYI